LPDFVDTAVREIDEQLRALKDEAARLQAARAALTGGRPARSRSGGDGDARTQAGSAARRNARSAAPRPRRGTSTRANQALELVRNQPGITIPEIAQAMNIQPNYLYRVLPRLASDGEIKRAGQGWHPTSAPSSTSTTAKPRQRRAATSPPASSETRTTRRRRETATTQTGNGRTSRGATTASVLAALDGGEAMTASQVAAKAGLARPTVSTTLSKLAKSGEVQKARRGYRLTARQH
jgi:DNA-binding IscR family transcriptional regulator